VASNFAYDEMAIFIALSSEFINLWGCTLRGLSVLSGITWGEVIVGAGRLCQGERKAGAVLSFWGAICGWLAPGLGVEV
jgi:hypothetical protein